MDVLRIILIVLGSLIAFILLVLAAFIFCRIKIELVYREKKYVRFHFLLFHYTIDSEKKKKEKKPKKEKSKKAKKKKEKPEKKGDSSQIGDRLLNMSPSDVFSLIGALMNKFISKIYVQRLELDINVATPAADKTALLYGQINAGLYPILGFIDAAGRLGKTSVNITPDFSSEKLTVSGRVIISTRVLYLLSCLIYLLKKKII